MAFPERFDVWMDSKSLDGGLQWRPAIRKAIREADFFIAVLSSGSVVKRGVINQELYEAVDVWKEFPPNQIFLIPARVEECTSPFEDLAKMNYVNLFPDWNKGLEKLITTLDKELAEENRIPDAKPLKNNIRGYSPDGLDGLEHFEMNIRRPKNQHLLIITRLAWLTLTWN
jgi:hypothetical protein